MAIQNYHFKIKANIPSVSDTVKTHFLETPVPVRLIIPIYTS